MSDAVLSSAGVAARYLPDRDARDTVLVPPPAPDCSAWRERDFAVPPPKFWVCFEESEEDYLRSGEQDVATLRQMLAASGYPPERARRILDFGCAAGRMTRWLVDLAESREIWGADISGRCISWCSDHLSPPFHFVTTTTFPHLPFPDAYFDVVIAASVFSNLADFEVAWLLELRRLLQPDGRLYVTVNDGNSIAEIATLPPGHRHHWLRELLVDVDRSTGFSSKDWATLVINPGARTTQVFHDLSYLRATWGRLFHVYDVRNDALLFQTGLILGPKETAPAQA